MAEQMSLDDVLSGKDPKPAAEPAPVVEPAPAAAPPAPSGIETSGRRQHQAKEREAREAGQPTGRNSDGTFAPKEGEPATAPKAAEPAAPKQDEWTPKEKALLTAAQQERGKRQQLEAEFNAFKAAQSQQAPAQPQGQPAAAKTFYEDPEGYFNQFRQEITGNIVRTKLDTSEAIARSRYPDFNEKVSVFVQAVQQNPALNHQMLQSPDPGEFAYNIGKNLMAVQQAGSIDQIRAQIEKDTRAKVEAEMKEKYEKERKELAALPRSLSETPGKGVSRPVWGGPTSFDEILKH